MASILLIEDVDVVRLVLKRILERGGHQVTEATDGVEGLRLFESGRFDVVVTDIWMPGGDGLTFIKSVRAKRPTARIVAVSGGAPRAPMTFSLSEAEAAGAGAVLLKPVDRTELLDAVNKALQAGN